MMYKRPHSRFWWCKFTAPNGSRVQQSTKTVDKQQAREFEDRLRANLWRTTRLGDKPRRSWKEAVVRWTKEATHRKTMSDCLLHIKWVDPYLGNKYLDEINRDLLEVLIDKKLKTGVKPASVNRMLEVVRTILNKAEREWEWIDRAPAVRMLKEPSRRIRWITRDEANRLLQELPDHLEAMARFSLATGLRQSNVTGLEWNQLDLERRVAWIHADQAKAGKLIGIPLNNEAVVTIRQQVGKHNRFVFTYRGNRVNQCNTKAWKAALARAGIKDFRWHDLRHTWASWHVQNGTPLHALQELGGWSDIRMVQRYAHLAPEHLSEYADRLCEPKLVSATLLAAQGGQKQKAAIR